MTPAELDSLFAAMDSGDSARSAILETLSHIHDRAESIRAERIDEWKRIRAHQGIYYGMRSLFHVEHGSVDSFDTHGSTITVTFRFRGYKGDGDSFESVSVPLGWLTLSDADLTAALTAQFEGYLAAARLDEAKKAAVKETEEKAQLAALLAKHGAPTT